MTNFLSLKFGRGVQAIETRKRNSYGNKGIPSKKPFQRRFGGM